MKTNRIFALLLAVVMLLSIFTGCNTTPPVGNDSISSPTTSPSDEEACAHIWSQTESEATKAEYDAYLATIGKTDDVPVDEGYIAKYYRITRSCSHCNETETRVERRDEIDPDYHRPTQDPSDTNSDDITRPDDTTAPTETLPEPNEGDKECVHTYATKVTFPTCDTKGYTKYTCNKCGKSYTSDYTNATGHGWSSWSTKAATCTTDGSKTRSCSNCKKVESEVIKATGHSFGAWQVKTPATCEHGGMETRQCSKCSITSSRTTAATDHNWDSGVKTVVPTSCSDMGVIKYTCQTCGKTKTSQISGSHSFGSWKYEAYTYEVDASDIAPPGMNPIVTYTSHRKVRACTKCGFKEYQNFGDHVCELGSRNHKVTIIKDPVCDTPGIKRSKCKICGWYEDFEYAPNTGISHKWVDKKVHLSDYTQYTNELDATISTCSACGKKSVVYHYGKGYNEYYRWRVPVGVEYGTAYAGTNPVNDNFKWVDHPTWQMVTRDYVYDADGYVKQFTVYAHDKNGKRYSVVVKCGEGEIEALFASAGMTPSKKVTEWIVKIYGDTYGPYMIRYQ